MALPNPDPSNPALPAPVFADTDAGRGDHLRLNNQKIWQNEEYLNNGGNINDAAAAAPVDADKAGFWQTAGAGLKNVTFANLFVWVVGKVYALASKTTPADADQLLITDSAASNVGKSLTFANLFLWVGAKIAALTGKTTPADADTLPLTDSAASNVQKNVTFANLWTWVLSKLATTGAGTPVGTYIQHAGSAPPAGFIACDGASLLRAGTYADLFAVIGTTYGAADGTHFNLPDAHGLVMVGAGAHGTMTRANGTAYNGGTLGATRNDQLQGHKTRSDFTGIVRRTPDAGFFEGGTGGTGSAIDSTLITDGTNGTPRIGDETRPAEIAVLVCIKY